MKKERHRYSEGAEARERKVYWFLEAAIAQRLRLGQLKTMDICSVTVLEARSSKSRCWQSHAPSESSREDPFHVFLFAPDVCWQFLVSLDSYHSNRHLHLFMAFFALGLSVSSPLLMRTPVILD